MKIGCWMLLVFGGSFVCKAWQLDAVPSFHIKRQAAN